MLNLAVVGTSRKENEHRLPLHPDHFDQISQRVRGNLWFEKGYGAALGVLDEDLTRRFGGVMDRAELLAGNDAVLLPKPLPEDLLELRQGGVLWGWPHCVQQLDITQAAVDRKLTLIAWEAMFTWKKGGVREMHIFERNNEMAGYCAVIHALGLTGLDGLYGPGAMAVVLSHGSVSRGAIHALQGRGFADVTVYTQRPAWAVHDKIPGCRYGQMLHDGDSGKMVAIDEDGAQRPLVDALAATGVIVNGILQDTDHPLMFLEDNDIDRFSPGALIVDVSCDLGMGFPFARPTSFEEPAFAVGAITYYAVDHTPTHLWRSASWELSQAVAPFLETVMDGPAAWESEETIHRAIEIRDGVIQNPKVLNFQRRAAEYPHPIAQ
jgi:alanine dehydrogenase